MGDIFRSGASQFSLGLNGNCSLLQPTYSLGNFQLPQMSFNQHFDAPPLPKFDFTFDAASRVNARLGFSDIGKDLLKSQGFFAEPHVPVSAVADLCLEAVTDTAKHLELPSTKGLVRIGLLKSAAEAGKEFAHNATRDIGAVGYLNPRQYYVLA